MNHPNLMKNPFPGRARQHALAMPSAEPSVPVTVDKKLTRNCEPKQRAEQSGAKASS